jgi:protein-tyrosine-phosphatase
MMQTDALAVAFVCTGNRFRSPLAELLFRRAAAEVPLRTLSCGTLDTPLLNALPEGVEEAERLGLDLSTHQSRSIAGENLTGFELVIGFERHHLATAVAEAGAPRERTFTLPQLVGLVEHASTSSSLTGIERARETIEEAAAARGADFPLPEIADPIGRSRPFQREVANQIDGLVKRLAHGLFG